MRTCSTIPVGLQTAKTRAHWRHHTPQQPLMSPVYSWESGCETAPDQLCPCMEQGLSLLSSLNPRIRSWKKGEVMMLRGLWPDTIWSGGRPYQSCSLTVLSSKYMVFDRKSMPIVACMRLRHQPTVQRKYHEGYSAHAE